jgi:hypothetical protein
MEIMATHMEIRKTTKFPRSQTKGMRYGNSGVQESHSRSRLERKDPERRLQVSSKLWQIQV